MKFGFQQTPEGWPLHLPLHRLKFSSSLHPVTASSPQAAQEQYMRQETAVAIQRFALIAQSTTSALIATKDQCRF